MQEKMTKQDVLRKVREHFSQPGAVLGYDHDDGGCVYRGGRDPSSPVRCAFGCLIPDELYDPSLEGEIASEVLNLDMDLASRFKKDVYVTYPNEAPWIDRLQRTHDDCAQSNDNPADFLDAIAGWE